MSLATVSLIFGGVTALVFAGLALLFMGNPKTAFDRTGHKPEGLPRVMADRYIAFAILAGSFTLWGDLRALAVLFAVSALMGCADALIYHRLGFPHIRHSLAGAAGLIAFGTTLAALMTQSP